MIYDKRNRSCDLKMVEALRNVGSRAVSMQVNEWSRFVVGKWPSGRYSVLDHVSSEPHFTLSGHLIQFRCVFFMLIVESRFSVELRRLLTVVLCLGWSVCCCKPSCGMRVTVGSGSDGLISRSVGRSLLTPHDDNRRGSWVLVGMCEHPGGFLYRYC